VEHRRPNTDAKGEGLNALYSYLRRHAVAVWRLLEGPHGERGQGTVEYVGLILIVTKIKSAVNAITFK
jgi:hypothetical protein